MTYLYIEPYPYMPHICPHITVNRKREPASGVQAGLIEADEGPEVRGSEVHLSEDVSRSGKFDLKNFLES